MEVIVHRINNLSKLIKIPKNFGVEIDVRDFKDKLILSHDPFKNGESLDTFLKNYNHGTLIINVKSEYIEFEILKLLNKYKIKKYFFLDSSYPVLIKLNNLKYKNFAIRVSDYESIENIYQFRKNVKCIWLEIFSKINIKKKDIEFIKKNKINICLVSPELHNKTNYSSIIKILTKNKINIHYVCAKRKSVKIWEKYNFKFN